MESVTVACPIVYGSIAFYLGKKAEEFNTHRWTLYVRGPHDEDVSIFIDKVAFTLHPSFESQVRVVTQPPFEITETGWGEFEAGIRIFFKDPDEQPIDMFHQLRLYPPMAQQQLNVKKPVVAENYDEIVFYAPKPSFYNQLMTYGSTNRPNATPSTFVEYFTAFDDNLDTELLLSIKEHLDKEILEAKNRLVNLEAEYVDYINRKQQEPTQPPPSSSGPSSINQITSNSNANNMTTNTISSSSLLPSSSISSTNASYEVIGSGLLSGHPQTVPMMISEHSPHPPGSYGYPPTTSSDMAIMRNSSGMSSSNNNSSTVSSSLPPPPVDRTKPMIT